LRLIHDQIKTILLVPYSHMLSLGGPFKFIGQEQEGESRVKSRSFNAMFARPKRKNQN
jgi:hypothetical protein